MVRASRLLLGVCRCWDEANRFDGIEARSEALIVVQRDTIVASRGTMVDSYSSASPFLLPPLVLAPTRGIQDDPLVRKRWQSAARYLSKERSLCCKKMHRADVDASCPARRDT